MRADNAILQYNCAMVRSIPGRLAVLSALALLAGRTQPRTNTAALTLGVHWVVPCESNTGSVPMRAGETSAQYCLDRSAVIDQTDVASATFDMHATSKDTIELTLRDSSAQRFREATQNKVGLKLAVVLNGQLVSVATIAAPTERVWIGGLPREKAESVIQAFQRGATAKTPAPSLSAGRASLTQPDSSGVYRVGGGVSAPILIRTQEPEYTARARAARTQGTVVVDVVIGLDGIAGNIRVLKSLAPDLDAKAVECVRSWRFRPGKKDGEPVPVWASVEVNFRL